jgi:bifunctional non-homologous end joining protein LigD
MTASYPELAVLAGRVQGPLILDGEIVALGHGRPDFELLQSRMHVPHPPGRLVQAVPVQLHLFDLLYQGEESFAAGALTQRRDRLEDLGLHRTLSGRHRGIAAARRTSRPSASLTPWNALSASRWPLFTIRDSAGTGSRSRTSGTQEIIICGWKPGQGHRAEPSPCVGLAGPSGGGTVEQVRSCRVGPDRGLVAPDPGDLSPERCARRTLRRTER